MSVIEASEEDGISTYDNKHPLIRKHASNFDVSDAEEDRAKSKVSIMSK